MGCGFHTPFLNINNMKIKVEFSKNTSLVPFEYVTNLNGYLHKILGNDNEFHDKISLYSTSFLHGGKMSKCKKGLNFLNGATWFVSSPDVDFINKFINSIYENVEFAFGMELIKVGLLKYEFNNEDGYYRFKTKSPVLLKSLDFQTKKNKYLTHEDGVNETSQHMKNIILKKAAESNLPFNSDDFEIFFDYEYSGKKIKWIKIRSVGNKTSVCPIIIKTTKPEIVDFIYNVGVGNSTGSGFGALV